MTPTLLPQTDVNQVHDSYLFFPETPMPASALSAFLRLGKKYVIPQLFEEAKRRLPLGMRPLEQASTISAAGNVILFPRVSGSDPFNFMVINVASEIDLRSTAVVGALYCCVACPMLSIADGYDFKDVRCVLSTCSKRYCFLVQRYLVEVEKQLFQSLAAPVPTCLYRGSSQSPCNCGLLAILRAIQSLRCPFMKWMDAWDAGLCVTCKPELKKRREEARIRLWKNLPVDLGLGCWEDIDKEAVIVSDAE